MFYQHGNDNTSICTQTNIRHDFIYQHKNNDAIKENMNKKWLQIKLLTLNPMVNLTKSLS